MDKKNEDKLVAAVEEIVMTRMRDLLQAITNAFGHKGRKGKSPKTEEEMRCRHAGCKARSKGPRFRFLCEKHLEEK